MEELKKVIQELLEGRLYRPTDITYILMAPDMREMIDRLLHEAEMAGERDSSDFARTEG